MSSTELFDRAKCRGNDTEWFFPEHGANIGKQRAFCSDCPVRLPCLQYALDHELNDGVWGGTSPTERKNLRRARRLSQR
jgi:WhiB family transcriptional regulator, redox-sensing transcriptional regulator